ncbi:alpha/beta hydrolase [Pseudohalioglobus sediminis]|uniref:Alpha/beta hydrolase n=2 Tax=Pseudohalioglobus sediminis TaxID=2606449 RepID=A0A5B0WWA0_9GAMM|nr:alpha/beta hydrolase [Pseudohalioglobus sediminis]
MSGMYFFLGLVSFACTCTALVQARRLYWAAPLYFFAAWLSGELAMIHLLWQVALTAALAFFGVLDDRLAQAGLGLFALSWMGLVYLHIQAMDTQRILRRALRRGLGIDYRCTLSSERQRVLEDGVRASSWMKPFSMYRDGVRVHSHISYADGGKRNLLDIYHPQEPREGGFPVLLQVHGGGWMIGEKEQQAKPLMYHLAQRGWLCVAINYRLSPLAAFPAHIIDVKKSIAWIRENISQYGGNPDFIAITGGSAGGHLSSLAALTPNHADFQPGFEDADTAVQAAVPFYGVYDLLDRYEIRPEMSMEKMLSDRVMQCTREQNPELWESSSPLAHVHEDSPPMFVIHGTHDTLVWVEEARTFVSALQKVAKEPVVYGELPGAQHAFEVFHSVRTDHTVNAVTDFLEWTHARWLAGRA